MPPQVIVRAADGRPFEIQDLCPSDAKFKIIVFLGDVSNPSSQQTERVNRLSREMGKPKGFLTKFGKDRGLFDVMTVCVGTRENVAYLDVPALFRSHWTK